MSKLPKARPALGHMPFHGHRTQEQVRLQEEWKAKFHHKLGPEMTPKARRKDAIRGSAMLLEAIRGMTG